MNKLSSTEGSLLNNTNILPEGEGQVEERRCWTRKGRVIENKKYTGEEYVRRGEKRSMGGKEKV